PGGAFRIGKDHRDGRGHQASAAPGRLPGNAGGSSQAFRVLPERALQGQGHHQAALRGGVIMNVSVGHSDIDSLVLAVRDRESRRLIGEAITAYRGGAFRSAIMSTWIAVA